MKATAIYLFPLLVFVLSGCGSDEYVRTRKRDTHEKVIDQAVIVVRQAGDELDKVKDADTAQVAAKKIQDLTKDVEELRKRARKLRGVRFAKFRELERSIEGKTRALRLRAQVKIDELQKHPELQVALREFDTALLDFRHARQRWERDEGFSRAATMKMPARDWGGTGGWGTGTAPDFRAPGTAARDRGR